MILQVQIYETLLIRTAFLRVKMKHCCLMAVYLTCHASCAQPALVWWTWTQGLICPWGLALPEHHPKLILPDIRWNMKMNSPYKICIEGGSLSVLKYTLYSQCTWDFREFGVDAASHHSQEVWSMKHWTQSNAAHLLVIYNQSNQHN